MFLSEPELCKVVLFETASLWHICDLEIVVKILMLVKNDRKAVLRQKVPNNIVWNVSYKP